MIQIANLTFGYRNKPPLFDQLDLKLSNGHIYGLLGKNGAGKTTLLKNIAGLSFPQSGSCMVNGWAAAKRQPSFLTQVYFLAEEIYVPDSSARTFVKNTSPFYPNFDKLQMEKYLQNFEVPDRATLSKLSLGQQKKFMISFALACNTPLLILDEPTNGLDIPSKAEFRKVISSAFDEKRCILISTHQVRDLDNLIDTILVLHDRQIKLHISIDELMEKICFRNIHPDQIPHSLYHENTINGVQAIMSNPERQHSLADLELLFNSVTQKEGKLSESLTTI